MLFSSKKYNGFSKFIKDFFLSQRVYNFFIFKQFYIQNPDGRLYTKIDQIDLLCIVYVSYDIKGHIMSNIYRVN